MKCTLLSFSLSMLVVVLTMGSHMVASFPADLSQTKANENTTEELGPARIENIPDVPMPEPSRKPEHNADHFSIGDPVVFTELTVTWDDPEATLDLLEKITTKGTNSTLATDILVLKGVTIKDQQLQHIVYRLRNTHVPYVGEGHLGGMEGNFTPVFYRRDRFSAVNMEKFLVYDNDDPSADLFKTPPSASYVVLMEKETYETTLIVTADFRYRSKNSRDKSAMNTIQKSVDDGELGRVNNVIFTGDVGGDSCPEGWAAFNATSPPQSPSHLHGENGTCTGNPTQQLCGRFGLSKDASFPLSSVDCDSSLAEGGIRSLTFQAESTDFEYLSNAIDINLGALLFDRNITEFQDDDKTSSRNKTFTGQMWILFYGAPIPKDIKGKIKSIWLADNTWLHFGEDGKDMRSLETITETTVLGEQDERRDRMVFLLVRPAIPKLDGASGEDGVVGNTDVVKYI